MIAEAAGRDQVRGCASDSPQASEQKFGVRFCVLKIGNEDLHRLASGQLGKLSAKRYDPLVFVGVEEELLAARSGFYNLDGGKNTHLCNGAVEVLSLIHI